MSSLQLENCYSARVDLPVYSKTEYVIFKFYSLKSCKGETLRKCNVCDENIHLTSLLRKHLKNHEHAWEEYLVSLAQTLLQKEEARIQPDLIKSSDEDDSDTGDDDGFDTDDQFDHFNVVDSLEATTRTRNIPSLTPYEKKMKRLFTYDDQTDPDYQEFSDYDVFQLCNWWRKYKISQFLGEALPETRMDPQSLYNQKNSPVVHMIDRLICPRNCYYEPERCFFDDQHTHDYKELLQKEIHDRFNPEFATLFEQEEGKVVKLTRLERNHPDTTKLAEDIGFTTKLEYDSDGYLLVNFDAIDRKFWDYETPQFVLEQKKVLDILLALLLSTKAIREQGNEKIAKKYEQKEIGLNPPPLRTMHHGPDLELTGNNSKCQECDLEYDERKCVIKACVMHRNCRYLQRSDHWTYKHNSDLVLALPSGSKDEYAACIKVDHKLLEGPVSMLDQTIAYPCNLKHCWIGCDCRFCKLARNYNCRDHKHHMENNLRKCMLQQAAQCQEHWIDHPDNFTAGDIEVMKNILFHNGKLLANGRQYCTKKVKYAGLKLQCLQCREDVREHFSKHSIGHSQCKLCLYELKTVGEGNFWETVCQVCGRKYTSKKVRDHHQKKHEEEKHECHHCEAKMSSKFALKRHLLEQHNAFQEGSHIQFDENTDDKDYHCNICKKVFGYKRNLLTHIENVHNKNAVCECNICGKEMTKSSNLKRHLMEQHSVVNTNRVLQREEIPEFQCKDCPMIFRRKDHLIQHMPIHQDTKTMFKCNECSASFDNRRNLERHIKVHLNTPAKYSCDICGYQSLQKVNLERHMKIHDENRQKYSCDLCEKEFTQLSNLERHTKLHDEPGKKYRCEFCEKDFNREDTLKIHKKNSH